VLFDYLNYVECVKIDIIDKFDGASCLICWIVWWSKKLWRDFNVCGDVL